MYSSMHTLTDDELLRLVYNKSEPTPEELELAERFDAALNDISELTKQVEALQAIQKKQLETARTDKGLKNKLKIVGDCA